MSVKDRLQGGFQRLLALAGTPIRIQSFSITIGSVYDDAGALTKIGADLWTSGIVLPIDQRRGSFDSVLVEQGKLINEDIRLFVNGSLAITGSEIQVTIGIGSPPREVFTTIPDGTIRTEIEGVPVYKKVFLSRLPIGSLIGQ